MYCIGDRVKILQTGAKGYGTVIGYITSKLYCTINQKDSQEYTLWTKLYPDWINKNVVYIEYDEPKVYVTFEEYEEQFVHKHGCQHVEVIKFLYDKEIKPVIVVATPEEDVFLIRESLETEWKIN